MSATCTNPSDPEHPLLEIEATVLQTGLVFMLHGIGDTAYGMLPFAETCAKQLPHLKFVLPTAPGRSWYTIDTQGHMRGHEGSHRKLLGLTARERDKHGLPLSKVVFIGFSQGAMVASWTALQLPQTCGGLVILSGGAPWELEPAAPALPTKVLYIAGARDRVVTSEATRECRDLLLRRGLSVDYIELPDLGHYISADEMSLVCEFLRGTLSQDMGILADSIKRCGALGSAHWQSLQEPGFCIPNGSLVVLCDSHGAVQPNGSSATVRTFDAGQQLYAIDLPCGTGILLARSDFVQKLHVTVLGSSWAPSRGEDAQVIGVEAADDGGVQAYVLQLQDGPVQRLHPQRVALPHGAHVRVAGLRGSGLNGRPARIRQLLHGDGRYVIEVEGEDGREVRVRPQNLWP